MIEFLHLPEDERRTIIEAVAARVGLPEQAVEKDWWVTLALQAVFATEAAPYLAFKGGTSLSKCWNLIERFSEDIDLAIDQSRFGYGEDITNMTTLRKRARAYVRGEFRDALIEHLRGWGVTAEQMPDIIVVETDNKDADPTQLCLQYHSLYDAPEHLKEGVLLEVSARSLREPVQEMQVASIIGQNNPDQPFFGLPVMVTAVHPRRTFLEKAFLLHETFAAEHKPEKWSRKSRHFYDLVQIMGSEHGDAALADEELFEVIRHHRSVFSPIKGVAYEGLSRQTLRFIPPDEILSFWEADYRAFLAEMVYGIKPTFSELMDKLRALQARFDK